MMPGRRRMLAWTLAVAALATIAIGVDAQQRSARKLYVQSGDLAEIANVPYDGRFTFARIRFTPTCCEDGRRWRVDRKWDHDTPRAEIHFMKLLDALTTLEPFMDGPDIFAFDDPELMKYPVGYVSEPGFWNPTEREAQGMRDYLAKGGFLIFDDFIGPHWYNFEQQMRRVLPAARLVKLDVSHPIFDSFFHITSIEMMDPYNRAWSEFYGVFEDNDPSKRLILVANYNNDIGDYWEWSDEGFIPIKMSNEAYKLGVNYVIYAMTH